MPSIRKKTSNRGTTNNRKKISQKVRETRKKRARAAKQNVQWKSKHKKDPGIPNDFPYKDQILAEVQEERRLAIEEKQRRKDAKKGAKTGVPEAESADIEIDENTEVKGFDGIASIAAKALRNVKLTRMERKGSPVDVAGDDEDEEEPALFNRDLPHLKSVLEHTDVIVQVLDCRDPLAFRSSKIEELSKPTVLVLHKIDLCPQEAVSAWMAHLRADHRVVLFRSASAFVPCEVKHKCKVPVDNAIGVDALLKLLSGFAEEKTDGPLAVAVVGFTNTGKSSLINSVARKAILPTYTSDAPLKGPTTTVLPQEVTVQVDGKQIKFVDTPGISWEREELNEENRARDILLRNKGRIDRLKEPMAPVTHIVSRANHEDLMVYYSLPAFSQGDVDAFLPGLARSKQLIKRRGIVDMTSACRVLLRDWNTGALRWFTMPASKATVDLNEEDKLAIETLQTRRELRKRGGLVKLSTGEIDTRLPAFEHLYTAESDDETSEEEEDEEEEGDEEEAVELYDDIEEQEELPTPSLSGKQKRKRGKEPSIPNKRQPKPKPTEKTIRKVANAPSKSRPTQIATSGDAAEAYDFGKFF